MYRHCKTRRLTKLMLRIGSERWDQNLGLALSRNIDQQGDFVGSVSSGLGLKGSETKAELAGFLPEVMDNALAVALLVVGLSLVDVLGAFCKHGVDKPGELMSGGSNGLRSIKSRTKTAVITPNADWLVRSAEAAIRKA